MISTLLQNHFQHPYHSFIFGAADRVTAAGAVNPGDPSQQVAADAHEIAVGIGRIPVQYPPDISLQQAEFPGYPVIDRRKYGIDKFAADHCVFQFQPEALPTEILPQMIRFGHGLQKQPGMIFPDPGGSIQDAGL